MILKAELPQLGQAATPDHLCRKASRRRIHVSSVRNQEGRAAGKLAALNFLPHVPLLHFRSFLGFAGRLRFQGQQGR